MRVLLVALFCTGCAAGTITTAHGRMSGIAFGAARLECCEGVGAIERSSGSADGAMVGTCARMTGGNLSQAVASLFGAAIAAAVTYFSGGL